LLDGKEYTLARNDGANHLHGGVRGFDKMVWAGRLIRRSGAAGIRWTYTSSDGEEGYPGTLKVTIEYVLTEENELCFEYWAVTDAPTPINLTNHSYWNLAGAGSGTILEQEISFNCPFYLPVDEGLIPTGEVAKTAGTPFDFSSFKPIGRDIGRVEAGFDHCMVVAKPSSELGLACTARDTATGRTMQVWTTKPGVQFYTANFLDGKYFPRHSGFCLETQYFPDSVNKGHFPSCILRPGETYHHRTVHKFSA
jgi:aldose 1-epimerase